MSGDDMLLPIGQRGLDLLAFLLKNPGRLITKNELMEAVWPGIAVEDSNLTSQIWALRKALGDHERPHRWIITVPGRGYRFVGAVEADMPDVAVEAMARPLVANSNLPTFLTRLFGREHDIDAVCAALAQDRLITLQGPGGIGKTRLAVEAALRLEAAFPDGAVFVDLAVVREGGGVAVAAARALGVDLNGYVPPLEAVTRHLAGMRLLILLDNCEHVADAAAELAEAVLAAAPSAGILATSRERLACAGERLLPVAPLSVPAGAVVGAATALEAAAVALLVDRVQAIDRHFVLTDDQADAAVAISRKLDGLPLAIEMVGAWVPVFGLAGVAGRLEVSLPNAGARTAAPRHRSLDAALDWSHGLLGYEERLALRRLAVFPAGFTLEAAEIVIGDAEIPVRRVADILVALHGKALVTVVAIGAAPAFRLLETTRVYAYGKLAAAGEADALQKAHARHVAMLLQRAERDWEATADQVWVDRYAPALDDVRAALDWALGPSGDRELGLILLGRSWPLWGMLSLYSEGRRRIMAALPLLEPGLAAAIEAPIQLSLGMLTMERAFDIGRAAFARAAELYKAIGEQAMAGFALGGLGQMLALHQRTEEAIAALAEARALLAGSGRHKPLGTSALGFALIHAEAQRWAEARQEYETAAMLYGSVGAERLLTATLINLADAIWSEGDLDAAIDAARRAVAQGRQSGSKQRLGRALANLAGMLIERGDLADALPIAQEAAPLNRDDGFFVPLLDHLAALAGKAGRPEAAARLWGYTDAELKRLGNLRQPNERRAIDDLALRLADRLAPAELAQLKGLGALMTEDQASALAFA